MASTVAETITFATPNVSQWIRAGREGSTQTFNEGALLIRSSGLLIAASADATADIVGVAVQPAKGVSGSECLYVPAWAPIEFEATLEDESNNNHVLVAGNMFTDFAMQIDSTNGRFYLDENDTTNTCAVVTGFKDAIGTTKARVFFKFLVDTLVTDT